MSLPSDEIDLRPHATAATALKAPAETGNPDFFSASARIIRAQRPSIRRLGTYGSSDSLPDFGFRQVQHTIPLAELLPAVVMRMRTIDHRLVLPADLDEWLAEAPKVRQQFFGAGGAASVDSTRRLLTGKLGQFFPERALPAVPVVGSKRPSPRSSWRGWSPTSCEALGKPRLRAEITASLAAVATQMLAAGAELVSLERVIWPEPWAPFPS